MVNTTIALTRDVYQHMLSVKHDMEKRVGRPISFSDAVDHLCDRWNNKLSRSDLNENSGKNKGKP